MVSIKYPVDVKSNNDRYTYLYRLQELLKLEHNEKGTQFRNAEITKEQWKEYQLNDFDPKSDLISTEICKYRKSLKEDTKNSASLSNIQE